jgi:signal transduction histidine kinase
MANSLEAMGEGGTVSLRVSAGSDLKSGQRQVRVWIADNGQGINTNSLEHIFEPFFTTKCGVGTGLGLWVTKQIIDKHGGTIRVRSCTGGVRRGTVFSVILPVGSD